MTFYLKIDRNIRIVSILIIFFIGIVQEQSVAQQVIIPLQNELNFRLEKEFFSKTKFHSNIKPYIIEKKTAFDSLNSLLRVNTKKHRLNKILNDDLIDVEKNNFSFSVNPILSLFPAYNFDSNSIIHDNQFGLNVNAYLNEKLSFNLNGFYGIRSFSDDWDSFVDSTGIIPHYGKIINKKENGYDYLSINGYISYQPLKYINLQLGKGKNFWGEGYRSLFLSDNSNSYPYFKAIIDIWKFKYIWMVGALNDVDTQKNQNYLYSKLQFSHYLSWNATKWLNFNFFESIISNPVDSMGVRYFNVNYLNPVIFFRPIEFAGGSADNAVLGIGFKLKVLKKYQLYSQLIIDEFVLSEIKSNNGWWGNKYGIQAGVKIFDLFSIKNLMFLGEFNLIRPYTYSYSNSIQNYGNHKQALAHPSGANLKEGVFLLHYHYKRFSSQFKGIYQINGIDYDSVSYGKDIYKPYTSRSGDYGHYTTQGLLTKYLNMELKCGWLINPKYFTQLQLAISTQQSINSQRNEKHILFLLGIKSLIFNESLDFP
ncbi:MAG: hypothetical protein DRJ10_04635 [Bacteroidetes bacterium]|nr:MAG: hypothetical protein DRJ10_04635 [Bacteroidota bacterium]